MKKIISILLIIMAGYFGWKYWKNPDRKQTAPEQTLDSVGSYLPNAIERKNNMEDNIKNSVSKENARLNSAMNELK